MLPKCKQSSRWSTSTPIKVYENISSYLGSNLLLNFQLRLSIIIFQGQEVPFSTSAMKGGRFNPKHFEDIQQSPDNHTMLNHTTLLFTPNFPGIKWNSNKFSLIITQKSPDNHTISSQFSTFTAFICQILLARKHCLWF